VAERPSYSSSPIALSPTTLQVESGYLYLRDDGSVDLRDQTLPLALMRVGLFERVELQIAWAGHSWTEIDGNDIDGASDTNVGVKWQLTATDATVPLALFAGLSLPTGNSAYSSDEFDPSVGLNWSYSGSLQWFGTLLVSDFFDDLVIGNGVGIGLSLATNTGAFLEYVAQYREDGGTAHVLNSGITWLPRNDMQLDINAGFGLNDRAIDITLGMGIAYRF
jgi:hypothetical protein